MDLHPFPGENPTLLQAWVWAVAHFSEEVRDLLRAHDHVGGSVATAMCMILDMRGMGTGMAYLEMGRQDPEPEDVLNLYWVLVGPAENEINTDLAKDPQMMGGTPEEIRVSILQASHYTRTAHQFHLCC